MSTTNKTRIRRFTPVQRFFHLMLMLAFLTQASTGLGRMYIETAWGKSVTWVFGGYEMSRTIHVYVGILMICGFLVHAVYLLFRIDWRRFPKSLTESDSLLPKIGDIKDFFRHIAWFFGAKEAPQFDRWGYWEKFDYWAVFWGIPLLGITGLLLAYPITASNIIPGWGLNVAFWIHRIEAILAMTHVFIIHFFIGHLRRHNFPMDRAMFEGSVSLEETSHERPAWIARLKQGGELEARLVAEAPLARRIIFYTFGYIAIAVGAFLLIGGLVNVGSITW
jgi:cytochrome b subunit of formate dehydrogenase